MTLVPVPGAGAGVLTPAGNLASFIDRALLGRHLLTPLYDPEGLLSTVPAIATALCGVFAGDWLKRAGRDAARRWAVAAGFAAMLAGLAWGRVFPINKNLWTSSFALFSAGMAAQVLAVVPLARRRAAAGALVAPVRRRSAATRSRHISVGRRSTALLTRWTRRGRRVAQGRCSIAARSSSWLRPCCGAEAASLGYAIAYVVLWGAILGEMHRRRMFIGI